MKITFQKQTGILDVGITFFWRMQIEDDRNLPLPDSFIPELFYDYFFVQKGAIYTLDPRQNKKILQPQQTLKTIHTHRFTLWLTPPLILYGARLSLAFAELFWQKEIQANTFLPQNWIEQQPSNLPMFAEQVTTTVQRQKSRKTAVSMLSPTLEESPWLANYSPRHKRRLYKSIFGISRKEIQTIQNIHTFLSQACDFTTKGPHIIDYLNNEQFYDQSHLSHTFKKITGLSLLEYFEANTILQDNLMAVK